MSVPLVAEAAGLGRIVVLSGLGQPLRAEIEVSATREELSGMRAQLANPEAYKAAGLDYATTLLGIRFALEQRPGGQAVIKLTSERPINDPFVDMLLELNWPAGRLIREYTFLLDPPELVAKTPAPVAPAVSAPRAAASPQANPAAAASAPRASAIDEGVRQRAQERLREAPAPRATSAAAPTFEKPAAGSGGETREVRRGETLSKIAGEVRHEGVSLEQMLVGLLRANQDAFDGGNMNRLKAGKILSIPERSALEAVSPNEAKQVVMAQASDWNAYRSKLAGIAAQSPGTEDAAKQESSGKITAKVDDKATPQAAARDELKVSRTESGAGKAGAAGKAREEDLIARDKALKEANERLALLQKNVADLQKLVEMKNQSLADLQKQATTKTPTVESGTPQVAPPPPAPIASPPVVAAAPVASAPVTPPPPVTAPAVAPAAPAEPAPALAVTPPAPTPAPTPVPAPAPEPVKAKAVPPPPPPEPSFLDELLDNPLALGGAGLVALLAGYLVWRRRRAANAELPLDLNSTLSPPSISLSGNSVFRNTGGQSVDTSHTPVQTDFSQAGPGSIDTDEVDPVAEADVYMAYGRDAQAEEILLEAKQKDPKRYAIHLKLLEIYANRKDVALFETLATELYGETGGAGADWEKAALMGLQLDPANPLFSAYAPAVEAEDPEATLVDSPPPRIHDTVVLPGAQLASDEAPATPAVDPLTSEKADLTSLDFDLGLDEGKTTNINAGTAAAPWTAAAPGTIDFDLGTADLPESKPRPIVMPEPAPTPVAVPEAKHVDIDFAADDRFDLPADEVPSLPTASTAVPAAAPSAQAAEDEKTDTLISPLLLNTGIYPARSQPDSLAPEAWTVADANDEEAARKDAGEESLEFDVNLTASTVLGQATPPQPAPFDLSAIDLDLKVPEISFAETEVPALPDAPAEKRQTSTTINPDFFSAQAETLIMPSTVTSDADFEISLNEEIGTKLDLAKAYEEMGDFEGARELLHEVMKEGEAAHREKAQSMLAKIGE